MGIKLFAFGRRREGVTTEEFHRWWEDVHARGLADEPTLRRHVRRYELNHRLAEDYVRDRYRPEGTGRAGTAPPCCGSTRSPTSRPCRPSRPGRPTSPTPRRSVTTPSSW